MDRVTRKIHLIDKIIHLENDACLSEIEHIVLSTGKSIPEPDILSRLSVSIAPKLDLEAIKKKQNYQGFNRVEFDRLISEMNIQEPIEELLAMSK